MGKPNGSQDSFELRQHAWEYFSYHAGQRCSTFNFYVIISSLLATGYLTAFKDTSTTFVAVVLGLLLSFVSFVFWRLDSRTRHMIKDAEKALLAFEHSLELPNTDGGPDPRKIFTYEMYITSRERKAFSRWSWRRIYSYSQCFNLIFFGFGFLGLVATTCAVLRCLGAGGIPKP